MNLNKVLGIGIILVQLVDLAVHAGSGQVEPLRIAGSLLVAFWALRLPTQAAARYGGWLPLASYLALNAVFLWQNGLTNPASGALRIPLLVFVGLTSLLSLVLLVRRGE